MTRTSLPAAPGRTFLFPDENTIKLLVAATAGKSADGRAGRKRPQKTGTLEIDCAFCFLFFFLYATPLVSLRRELNELCVRAQGRAAHSFIYIFIPFTAAGLMEQLLGDGGDG